MIIAVAHQKGGVGKSTFAFNFAIEAKKLDFEKVQVIDLDLQKSLTFANSIRTSNSLESLCFNESKNLENIIQTKNKNILTIIDCGGFDSAQTRIAIAGADQILVPVINNPFEIAGLKVFENIIQDLEKIKESKIQASIVFNRIDSRIKSLQDLKNIFKKSKTFSILENKICHV